MMPAKIATDSEQIEAVSRFFCSLDRKSKVQSLLKHLQGEHDQKTHGRRDGARASKQTDSAEFKAWFGDSKVVDENGEPLVVYHGTTASFESFDIDKFGQFDEGWLGAGFYFASSPKMVEDYTRDDESRELRQSAEGGNIMPVFLSIMNPAIIDLESGEGIELWNSRGDTTAEEFTEALKQKGHDGVFFRGGEAPSGLFDNQYVAFDPAQIKSAIGNDGSFDPTNHNITKSLQKRDQVDPVNALDDSQKQAFAKTWKKFLAKVKHLPGEHDQKKHGNRDGGGTATEEMPGFINKEILTANRSLVEDLFGPDFFDYAMEQPEGTPFLTAWAAYTLVDHDKPKKQTDTPEFKAWFADSKIVNDDGSPKVVYHGTSGVFTEFETDLDLGDDRDRAAFFSSSPDVAEGYAYSGELEDKLALREEFRVQEDRDTLVAELFDRNGLSVPSRENNVLRYMNDFLSEGTVTRDEYDKYNELVDRLWEYEIAPTSDELPAANIKPVFLKLQNPRIIEADGASWDYIVPYALQSTDREKHDGIVWRNLQDSAKEYGDGIADTYAVFSPTNIKSAIGNDGSFDPRSPDITKSIRKHKPGNKEHDQSNHGRRAAGRATKQTDTPEFKRWFGKSKVVDENGEPAVVYHGTNSEFTEFDSSLVGSNTGNYGHYGYGIYLSYERIEAETYGERIIDAYVKIENPFVPDERGIDRLKEAGVGGIEDKVAVSIDFDSLHKAVATVDPVGAMLLAEINDKGHEAGWDSFLENNPGVIQSHEGPLDLNEISDLMEYTNHPSGDYKPEVPGYVMEQLDLLGIGDQVNYVKDWEHKPAMHYVTGLGEFSKEITDVIKELGHDGIIYGSEIVVFDPSQIKSASENDGGFDPKNPNIRKHLAGTQNDHDQSAHGRKRGGQSSLQTDTPEFKAWFGDSKIVNKDGTPKIVYHGTEGAFTEFNPTASQENGRMLGDGIYLTTSADKANYYATGEGGNVMPLYVRAENIFDKEGTLTEDQRIAISNVLSQDIREEDKSYHTASPIQEVYPDERKQEAHDLFDARLDHWKEFGEGYDRYRPRASKEGTDWVIDYFDPDVIGVAESGQDAFSQLMNTYGYSYTKALAQAGIDAVQSGSIIVVTDPSQVKSAIGNDGSFDRSNDDMRKSIASKFLRKHLAGTANDHDQTSHGRRGSGAGAAQDPRLEQASELKKEAAKMQSTLDGMYDLYTKASGEEQERIHAEYERLYQRWNQIVRDAGDKEEAVEKDRVQALAEKWGTEKQAERAEEMFYDKWKDADATKYDSPEYQKEKAAARAVTDAWEEKILRGITFSELSQEDAEKLGYRTSNRREYELLPDKLWHVTTAADKILDEGFKTRSEQGVANGKGLGGGEDDTISFTWSKDAAHVIQATMLEAHDVATNKITPKKILAEADRLGVADKVIDWVGLEPDWDPSMLEDDAYRTDLPADIQGLLHGKKYDAGKIFGNKPPDEDHEWTGVAGTEWGGGRKGYALYERKATPEEQQWDRFQLYKRFLGARSEVTGRLDPFFFSTDVEGFAAIDPDQIQIIEADTKPNTRGYQISHEKEWRVHFGDALEVVGVVEPKAPDVPNMKSMLRLAVTFRKRLQYAGGGSTGRWLRKHKPGGKDHEQKDHGKRGPSRRGMKFVDSTDDGPTVNGEPIPEHIPKWPPAWTDVQVADDPGAALLVVGKDDKGRRQAIYSESHSMKRAALKYAKIRELRKKAKNIRREIDRDKAKGIEEAFVLELIQETGIRPGSDRDRGGDAKAYGAATLLAEHVKVSNSDVRLQFTGKKGVSLDVPVRNKQVAKVLIERKKTRKPNEELFDVSSRSLVEYARTTGGGKFTPKDFRTAKGTTEAARAIRRMPVPATKKDYKASVGRVAEKVASILGNTPTIALQSYIDPTVFTEWRSELESMETAVAKSLGMATFNTPLFPSKTDYSERLKNLLERRGESMATYKCESCAVMFTRRAASHPETCRCDRCGCQAVKLPGTDMLEKSVRQLLRKHYTGQHDQKNHGRRSLQADTQSKEFKAWFGDSKVVDDKGKPLVVFHGTTESFDAFDQVGEHGLFGPGYYFAESEDFAKEYTDEGVFDYEQDGSNSEVKALAKELRTHLKEMRSLVKQQGGIVDMIDEDIRRMTKVAWFGANEDDIQTMYLLADSQGVDQSVIKAVPIGSTIAAYLNIRNPFDVDNDKMVIDVDGKDKAVGYWDAVGTMTQGEIREGLETLGHDGMTGMENSQYSGKVRVWVAFEPTQVKSTDNEGSFDPDSTEFRKGW